MNLTDDVIRFADGKGGEAHSHNVIINDPEFFEWEKFTTAQTITSEAGSFAGVPLTDWEAAVTFASPECTIADNFDPTTGVFTPTESGLYIIGWTVQFAAGDTGYREAKCSIVHSIVKVPTVTTASETTRLSGENTTYLDGPDNANGRYFPASINVKHNQGDDLDVTYAALHVTKLF